MHFFKRFKTKFIEGILLLSSTVSGLAIVLIVVFLFREGIGIFGKPSVEEGFVLTVNIDNPVNALTAPQIKNIFDQKITNWKEIGGRNDSIILFRMDDITLYYSEEELGSQLEFLPQKITDFIARTPGVIAFISDKHYIRDSKVKVLQADHVTLGKFFSGKEWFPTAQPAAQLGFLPLVLGTLWISLGAILLALPFGLAVAIYMAEISNNKVRQFLKPMIELLAGIPSVVYGFFGLIVIVPLIQKTFQIPVGETALAGIIILAIMALPTIITISEDAIRTVPRSMKEASLALGASHFQTIFRVVLPYSASGITAAAVLGIGRAVGETMAVLMVTGNAAIIPHTILQPVRTIPATIAAELGEAPQGGLHFQALFLLGCILFLITMGINISVEYMTAKKGMNGR